MDPRLHCCPEEFRRPQDSDAIINIDYPLGMAAYHVMAKISVRFAVAGHLRHRQGGHAQRAIGVLLANVIYDEHSQNWLFGNCASASDILPI